MRTLLILISLSQTTAPHSAPPNTDSAPAIQALIDRAQAVTTLSGSLTVHVPQATKPYQVGSPVYLDGRNVELRGDGPGTIITGGANNYAGPPLVVGVSRLERCGVEPSRYRVPSILDPGRRALSTRGEAVLSITAHPLQFGGGSPLDYWTGPAYTWEFVIGPGRGVRWEPNAWLFGFTNGNGQVNPWHVLAGEDGVSSLRFFFRTADQADEAAYHTASFPTPGPWPHRITIQQDYLKATLHAWVDGAAQPVTLSSTDRSRWVPGARLARHDGMIPFLFGGNQPSPAPLDVHGFIVSSGLVFDPSKRTEVRADHKGPSANRYWETSPDSAVKTIAWLPLNDAPATHVKVSSPGPDGVGFWIPKKGAPVSSNLGIRDITIDTKLQQSIAIGYCFGVTLVDIHAGGSGLQAIGSIPVGCTYPVTLERCYLAGYDCAYSGWQQIVHGHNTFVGMSGRDGLRCAGGVFDWDRTTFTFSTPTTDCFIRKTSDPYGGALTIRNMLVDNETGGPRVAIIEVDHSANCPNQVLIDEVGISTLNQGAFVRLIGRRTKAFGDTFTPAKVNVLNISCFAASTRPAVQVDGTIGSWYGVADCSGNQVGGVTGHAENIKVIPPVTLVPPR